MPEIGPLKEVWAVVQNRRQRVYRGRSTEHVGWKLREYRRQDPQVFLVLADGSRQQLEIVDD